MQNTRTVAQMCANKERKPKMPGNKVTRKGMNKTESRNSANQQVSNRSNMQKVGWAFRHQMWKERRKIVSLSTQWNDSTAWRRQLGM